jgi:SOS-response transcriptional repressor LexA
MPNEASDLAKKFAEAVDAAKLKPSAIAEACGVTPQAVTGWRETGRIHKKHLAKLAELTGRPLAWWLGSVVEEPTNTYGGPDMRGRVPIISWVQAGSWSAAVDNFHPGDAEDWAPTTVPIRQHTYALRVRGDSMTNPNGEPTFPDGQVIVVEPEAIGSPADMVNQFVIVKRAGDDEATFKQLVRDGGMFLLKPLNPQWPMMQLKEGDVFCGVVREKVVRFF